VRLASGHTDRQIDRHTHALIAMLHIHTEVGYSLTALSTQCRSYRATYEATTK